MYIYAGSEDIAEYDNGAAPSSPSREFIYGNGELLAQVSGGATTYYQKDHLSVRMISDASGNVLGQQGNFPFGEAWYSASGNSEWVFTSYQHNQETGLEYAMARYYDPRTATFCSADPVEGDPNDPESWNRYVYARDNPVILTDPSGQFWLWNVLKIALLVATDIFMPPAEMPEILSLMEGAVNPTLVLDLTTLGAYAKTGMAVSNAIDQAKQQGQKQPQKPPQRVNCGSWSFNMTFVPPLPAAGAKGALNGKPPQVGDVAINPTDFGESDYYELANEASTNPANKAGYAAWQKLLGEQKDLNDAQISITPTSKLPGGMPSRGPYTATDAYDKYHVKPNTVDLYRTSTLQQARKLGRPKITGNVSLVPKGNVKCPQ